MLAYGIAQAQAFRDGNRRTAYFAVRHFLEVNDLAWLSNPEVSDDMLARRLNQIVIRQSATGHIGSPNPIEALLARRFERGSRMREHTPD